MPSGISLHAGLTTLIASAISKRLLCYIAEAIKVLSPACSEMPEGMGGMWGRRKQIKPAAAAAEQNGHKIGGKNFKQLVKN